jgi:hypothetical protein
MNRRAFLLGTAGTALILAGCSQIGGSSNETPATPAETAEPMSRPALVAEPDSVVGCADQIYPASGDFTRETSDIVVGPLAFPVILQYAPTWAFKSHPDGIKARIVLERATVVTLVVPEPDRDHVGLAYGPIGLDSVSVADAYRSVRFEACDGQRTQWSGELIVTASRCVTLDVWIDHEPRPRTVDIPVGTKTCL